MAVDGGKNLWACAVRNEWAERIDAAIPLGSEVKGDLVTPNALRDSGLMAGIPAGIVRRQLFFLLNDN
jgi:hypothetical protein